MNIHNARIIKRDGRYAPVITVEGRTFDIQTKTSLLALGLAAMAPLDANFEDDYDAPVEHTAVLPADPADGRPAEQVLEHFTTDPQVVALSKKFTGLAAAGEAQEGAL